MKSTIRTLLPSLLFAGTLTFPLVTRAQKAMPSDERLLRTYTANRETSLVGTVVKYETNSAILPMGAHVTLQTPSGPVDVHLGNAKVLEAARLEMNPGDNVRVVGELMSLGDGTYFAARIVQKGALAVAVRNARGLPLTSASTSTPAQREALRGVR
jgi:hypothetical protein